jgi:superfamily II DNA or RNA helicase
MSGALQKAQFIFCLFQSFDKVASELPGQITHVVVDECHHLLAATYRQVYESLMSAPALRYMLGMTATLVHRDDPTGRLLKEMFRQEIYIDFPWTTAKALGHFPPVEYLECLPTLRDGRDISTYAAHLQSFTQRTTNLVALLAHLDQSLVSLRMGWSDQVKAVLSPQYVVEVYLQYQEARRQSGLPLKRRTIVFAANCEEADQMVALFAKRGVTALSAHYKSSRLASTNLAQFSNGGAQVLVTVMMVNEGFDCADIDCVVMARLTESEIVFVQQMGRGLRKSRSYPDKEVAVLDLALNLRRRWRRLQKELPDKTLGELMTFFWHVGNFVGATLG